MENETNAVAQRGARAHDPETKCLVRRFNHSATTVNTFVYHPSSCYPVPAELAGPAPT